MQSATEIKRTARRAGVLYLAMSICAMVGYLYLHRLFFISGDPAATARSILAKEGLYRASIVLDLFGEFLFILVVLDLYRLFRDVDRNQARLMVALIGTGIAVQFATFVLNAVPLMLLSGADHLSAFSQQQLETLSYVSLSLAGKQGELLMSIWGLWLFPFAILTIKSGFLPKFLGALLVVTGVAYVVACVTTIAFPEHIHTVNKVAFPLYFGEFIVVLWLAFVGAKPRTAEG
jgi:Domain of unknown function (DUF4386)